MAPKNLSSREVLEKAYERLLPAFAYLHGSTAGLAASIVVFTTWLIKRLNPTSRVADLIERDEEQLLALEKQIEELEARISILEGLLSRASSERERSRLERSLKLHREELERLDEEKELLELRLLAVKKLRSIGEDQLIREVNKIIEKIEKGRLTEVQYEVLALLEERWRRRQISIEALRRIVEEG